MTEKKDEPHIDLRRAKRATGDGLCTGRWSTCEPRNPSVSERWHLCQPCTDLRKAVQRIH